MDKRQAKRVICAFLCSHLDMSMIVDFMAAESNGSHEDFNRLWEAAQELEQEMLRRSRNQDEQATS
jgi:hypothetical protein